MSVSELMPAPATGRFVAAVHHFPLRIYFEDTDLSGLVYHANYLRYMERARSDMLRLAGIDQRAAIESGDTPIVDARTPGRFTGELSSGYPGVAGGHMPGAVNIAWSQLIEQSGDFRFTSPDETRRLFAEAGVDLDRPVIATCGSGVTAAIIAFQLERLGKHDWRLYDASWHEWGQRDDLPKESI